MLVCHDDGTAYLLSVSSQVVKLSEIVSLAKEAQVDITFQLPI